MSRDPASRERSDDGGWCCWLATRAGQFWDFIDKRDVDKHAMAWLLVIAGIAGTWYLIDWTLDYAYAHQDKSGVELGLVVAAYMIPWNGVLAVVTFVIKWYFERQDK